ncbi:hypothetical protein E2C01_066020 [Portunus trituberculatus]|uniref:Uncharacterized protein n=1 Tax=Portunus trituberculatus TaxID=210409 RepID=A0A5B7HTE6_PORTR|nr:hypothetical protein [Portunus trituberculatus]
MKLSASRRRDVRGDLGCAGASGVGGLQGGWAAPVTAALTQVLTRQAVHYYYEVSARGGGVTGRVNDTVRRVVGAPRRTGMLGGTRGCEEAGWVIRKGVEEAARRNKGDGGPGVFT